MEANPNNLHTELYTIVWFANCTSPQPPLWRSHQKRERVEVKKDWCQKVGEWQILTFFTEMYEIMLEINQKARGRTIIINDKKER
jgi:L-lactate utilization protein LutC